MTVRLEDAIDVIDSIKMISEDMDNRPSETYLNTPHNCDTKYWGQLSLCQYQCPECGHIQYGDRNSELNYCSNCGSRNKLRK